MRFFGWMEKSSIRLETIERLEKASTKLIGWICCNQWNLWRKQKKMIARITQTYGIQLPESVRNHLMNWMAVDTYWDAINEKDVESMHGFIV